MRSNKYNFNNALKWFRHYRDSARYQMRTNSPWAASIDYQTAKEFLKNARFYYLAMKTEDRQFNNIMAY